MKYVDIWAKPQQRRVSAAVQHPKLPPKVKDWPEDARDDFKRVKNELWKWAKAKEGRDRTNLALIAYEAVKQAYDGPEEHRVITYDNEEDMWNYMKSKATSKKDAAIGGSHARSASPGTKRAS